ncbi:STAS domain-containing protein [Actinosynnema sp. CA-248983]
MTRFSAATSTATTGPVLTVHGDLDATTAPAVLEQIKGLAVVAGQLLVVDLAQVSFCDSSGISTLLAARNVTAAADARIALVCAPRQLLRTLDLIGLISLFPTYPTTAEAVAAHT